ncbi:EamA family transporter [Demequina salsinemoris]|uniref:EamA family transporter n=1 Tax=Demequina salsinemoris TaxID=577470 RepID=UPI000782D19B|nr:EamA family transporter [Demequina salsinemoris]
MSTRHIALAILTAVLWGVNFLAIHASLEQFPPLFLVALRFAIIAIPTMLLVPRPRVRLRWLIGYGLGFGTFQFLFLYLGMAAGFPTGLSSLVLQASAPFTVVLGAALLRERIGARAGFGVAVAALGLVVVGLSYGADAPLWPFLLVLLGALAWAFGNLASRQARAEKPLHLVLWMSVVPPLPMLAISLIVEGPGAITTSLSTSFTAAAAPAWIGLAYTVLLGTLAGSGIWVWLMSRHPAGVVAPFSMLVPVVGIVTAWLALGERPGLGELAGGVLVIGGVLWASRASRIAPPTPTPASSPAPDPLSATASSATASSAALTPAARAAHR